ncbi:MAG: hypothetical protein P8J32_08775, partial [bacterium]|nr:hypothetical protein [bacterium]
MTQHTHRFLYVDLAHSGNGEDAHYIDLAHLLSQMNRRLYRQGMLYHVANISIHDSQGDARVKFSTAPNTWATHTAWNTAFTNWKKMRALALDATSDSYRVPKWSDFKVYINKEHVIDTDWVKALDDEQNQVGSGEWDYSDISFWKSGNQYDNFAIGLMGNHQFSSITNEATAFDSSYGGYISCLEGLQEIWNAPVSNGTDPSFDDSVFAGMSMFNGPVIEDVLLEIEKEGDNPPYSTYFVGSNDNPTADVGAFPVRECHIASTYQPMARVGGFPVPCGLLQVETESGDDNTIGLLIEMAAGPYKGVLAENMGV